MTTEKKSGSKFEAAPVGELPGMPDRGDAAVSTAGVMLNQVAKVLKREDVYVAVLLKANSVPRYAVRMGKDGYWKQLGSSVELTDFYGMLTQPRKVLAETMKEKADLVEQFKREIETYHDMDAWLSSKEQKEEPPF
jgi:hypothetical protein